MSDAAQDPTKCSDQNKQSERIVLERDGIKFEAIEPSRLASVPVISYALDNQWFPQDLLKEAIGAGKVSDGLERRRSKIVRAEYIRSLINGDQVVINRAFFVNNPVLLQDYLLTSNSDPDMEHIARDKREAFKKLLEENVIIPYLIQENSPIQQLQFSTIGFEAWKKVCQEVSGMQCLRLSWDDEENSSLTKQLLAGKFQRFALGIAADDINPAQLVKDLGLRENDQEALKKQLLRVAQTSLDLLGKYGSINREDLYKAFVTIDKTNPAHRYYDKNKPFAGEIKQLLDLVQGRNLSDALDGYLLTPVKSLTRTALQELPGSTMENLSKTFLDDIKEILQRQVFDLVQSGAYLQSMDLLSLTDVLAIRNTHAWYNYIVSLRELLKDPLTFGKGQAQVVYENYCLLAEEMTNQINSRYQQNMAHVVAKTTFVFELIIEIGGGIISLCSIGDAKSDPIIQTIKPVFTVIGKKAVAATVRCVIRDIANHRADEGLSNSIQLMKRKITDAEKQWEDLLSYINSKIKIHNEITASDNISTLTPPEAMTE